jgi:predicted aldo/keto reductase-like oxidoreductase
MERRSFLKSVVATGAAAAAASTIPKREYRDGVKLSVIGFGGINVVGLEQSAADRMVARSVERGVNYFDVAPSYWDGEAETKLGNALRPYRKGAFLVCKTQKRDAAGAQQELEQSLQRLRTDHFDLYQFHAVTTLSDVDRILAPGGAGEFFVKAKKDGTVKYLGASCHSPDAAIALMDRFPLDSVLFPINFVLYAREDFGPQVIAHAKKKGVARLALKALAQSALPQRGKRVSRKAWYVPVEDRELAGKALRFTLSEEVTSAIPPGIESIYEMALGIAAHYTPLTVRERKELLAVASGFEPLFKQRA